MSVGLIFDFDGTILDTETPECTGWECLYSEHGLTFPRHRFFEAVGRGYSPDLFEPWTYLSAELKGALSIDDAKARHREIFRGMLEGQTARPGVTAWLEDAGAQGWGRAVASSSPRVWIDRHLPRLGLDRHFEAIKTKDDVAAGRTKPHPDLFLLACQALHVEPQNAIVIEDSENGVKAARAAGCYVIATPNPMTAHMDFSQADLVLESLEHQSLKELKGLR
ncbi:MAG: HAD-IA family hydrolase [Armatimonas sp.]